MVCVVVVYCVYLVLFVGNRCLLCVACCVVVGSRLFVVVWRCLLCFCFFLGHCLLCVVYGLLSFVACCWWWLGVV